MRLDHGTYTQAKTIESQAGAQDWIEYNPGDKILPSAVAYGRKCMFRLMDDTEVELCLYSGTTLPLVTKAVKFPNDVSTGEMITVMDGDEVPEHVRPPLVTPVPTPLPAIDTAVLQEMTNITSDSIPGFNPGPDFELVGHLNPWVDYNSSRHSGDTIQDSVDNTRNWTLESTGVDTRMGAFEFFDDATKSIQTDPLHVVDRSISVWFLPDYDMKMKPDGTPRNGVAAQMNLWSNHYRDDGGANTVRGGDECRLMTEWIDTYPHMQNKATRAGVVCSSQKAFAYDHTVEKSPRYAGWNNITVTIQSATTTGNSTNICLYLNGQLLECGTTTNNPTVASTSYPGKLFIGSFTRPGGSGNRRSTDPYAGLIGEVMLWQGTLTASAVNDVYLSRSTQYSSMPQSL